MDARSQVNEFERILKKTLQAYRLRITLIERRNKILSELKDRGGVINNTLRKSLLNVLNKERNIIKIILSEDELERRNIDIAIDSLKQVKKNPAIIRELKNRNIEFSQLKEIAKAGLKILKRMDIYLIDIEHRIELEERMLTEVTNEPIPNKQYLKVWKGEIRDEEIFRRYVLENILPSIISISFIGTGGGVTGVELANLLVLDQQNQIEILGIGIAIALGGWILLLRDTMKSQKYIDFHSKDVFDSIRYT